MAYKPIVKRSKGANFATCFTNRPPNPRSQEGLWRGATGAPFLEPTILLGDRVCSSQWEISKRFYLRLMPSNPLHLRSGPFFSSHIIAANPPYSAGTNDGTQATEYTAPQ